MKTIQRNVNKKAVFESSSNVDEYLTKLKLPLNETRSREVLEARAEFYQMAMDEAPVLRFERGFSLPSIQAKVTGHRTLRTISESCETGEQFALTVAELTNLPFTSNDMLMLEKHFEDALDLE